MSSSLEQPLLSNSEEQDVGEENLGVGQETAVGIEQNLELEVPPGSSERLDDEGEGQGRPKDSDSHGTEAVSQPGPAGQEGLHGQGRRLDVASASAEEGDDLEPSPGSSRGSGSGRSRWDPRELLRSYMGWRGRAEAVAPEAGESQSQSQAHDTENEPSSELMSVMVCANCRFPICVEAEIIEEACSSWKDQVYPYQLEILGLEDVPCYSATNPGGHRFDVVRLLPSAVGVMHLGRPTKEHSWFPDYCWRMAHCKACTAHLGWSFSKAPGAADPTSKISPSTRSPGTATAKGKGSEQLKPTHAAADSGTRASQVGGSAVASNATPSQSSMTQDHATPDSSALDNSGDSLLSAESEWSAENEEEEPMGGASDEEVADGATVNDVISLIMNDDDQDQESEVNSIAFHGVIVTRLREDKIPADKYEIALKYSKSLRRSPRFPCRQS